MTAPYWFPICICIYLSFIYAHISAHILSITSIFPLYINPHVSMHLFLFPTCTSPSFSHTPFLTHCLVTSSRSFLHPLSSPCPHSLSPLSLFSSSLYSLSAALTTLLSLLISSCLTSPLCLFLWVCLTRRGFPEPWSRPPEAYSPSV